MVYGLVLYASGWNGIRESDLPSGGMYGDTESFIVAVLPKDRRMEAVIRTDEEDHRKSNGEDKRVMG